MGVDRGELPNTPAPISGLDEMESGCEIITAPASAGTTHSFVSGEPDGSRLRVRYYRRQDDRTLLGRVWFGPAAEGPPGHAHGGSMAAVLDESMGISAWLAGHASVAAQITVHFRRMLPLGTVARLSAFVEKVEGRKVTTRARLCDAAGTPYCEAEGLFVVVGMKHFVREDREGVDG